MTELSGLVAIVTGGASVNGTALAVDGGLGGLRLRPRS
jgi:hypothetical protein